MAAMYLFGLRFEMANFEINNHLQKTTVLFDNVLQSDNSPVSAK